MDEWRAKTKRAAAALPAAASPSAKRVATETPKSTEKEVLQSKQPDVAVTQPSVDPEPTLEPSSSQGSDDPELVDILGAVEQVAAAQDGTTVVLEAHEASPPPSDGASPDDDDDASVEDKESSVDNDYDWLMPFTIRGECLGTVIEDGLEQPCNEPTNGNSQLCRLCARRVRFL